MKKNRHAFQILSALVCDDVRRENNGKEILIGVYSGKIIVPRLPTNIVLMAWLNILVRGPTEFPLDIRILDPNERTVMEGEVTVKLDDVQDTSSMIIPKFHLLVENEGSLKIKFRKGRGRWQTIIEKLIEMPSISQQKAH